MQAAAQGHYEACHSLAEAAEDLVARVLQGVAEVQRRVHVCTLASVVRVLLGVAEKHRRNHVSALASVARMLPGVAEVHGHGPRELAEVWYPFRFLCLSCAADGRPRASLPK